MKVLLIAQSFFSINAALMLHLGKEPPAATFDEAPEPIRASILLAIEERIAEPKDALPEGLLPDQQLQERLFRAVVDTLKALPDPADPSAPPSAVEVVRVQADGIVPITYIGRRSPYRDALYTGLVFERGETQLVRADAAAKMLKHPDQYALGKAAGVPTKQPEADAKSPLQQAKMQDEKTEQLLQEARDSIAQMDKVQLDLYAKQHFRVDIDKRKSVADLRTQVTQLVDQYGVAA